MATVLAETTVLRRLNTTLIEMFVAIALLLLEIRVFSVISRRVSETTAEIGLRLSHLERILLPQRSNLFQSHCPTSGLPIELC
jgi:hypothetical protein